MHHIYSRRKAIELGLGGLAGLATLSLGACENTSPSPTRSGPVAMQMLFWGTATRDTLTKKAIDLFHKRYTSVSISSNYTSFTDYWPAFDKLIAKGSVPALFQMDMRYIAKYARSGLMLDLTQLIYEQSIVLSDFDPLILAGSKVNNAIYGIPLGGNYQCLVYNAALLKQSGVDPVPASMSWDAYATYMANITQGLPKDVYGSADSSGDMSVYEIWIRQRGKELYTVDGKLAFAVADVADWFSYWTQMRDNHGCLPADLQTTFANVTGAANSPLAKGKCVFVIPHTNEFESYQAAIKQPVELALIPGGSQPGLYYKPSLLLSISSQTPYVDEAARFIDFLLNDADGIKAIGMDRGIPGSRKAQSLLAPSFTPTQQREISFTNMVSQSGNTRLKEVLDPPAASQVARLFSQTALDIAQKHTTVQAGAQTFYEAALKALA